MWTAKVCHPDRGHASEVECEADTLLDAALILSGKLLPGWYLDDLCCRGWIQTHSSKSASSSVLSPNSSPE